MRQRFHTGVRATSAAAILLICYPWSAPGNPRPPRAGQGAAEARAEPVIDLGELMDIFMKPLFDDLKHAVDKPPRNRRQMADVYRAAVKLAEASNLLFSRSLNRYTERAEWPTLGAGMRQAAADATFVALRNARPQDFEPVKAKYRAVAEACNACHRGLGTDARQVKP